MVRMDARATGGVSASPSRVPKTQTNRDPLSLAAVAIAVSCCALPVPAANENPAISRAINGGTNGLQERRDYYARARAVLGV